jgi:acetolactate synthase small subunit
MIVLKVHATSGLSAIVRIVNTLKRKQFKVHQLIMEECSPEEYKLLITVDENEVRVKKAIQHVRKLEDVYIIETLGGVCYEKDVL